MHSDWLSSRYASRIMDICLFYISQALAGETPFLGLQRTELGYYVVQGLHPAKPENASDIGISDAL